MSRRNSDSLQPTWWYVLGALVLGLVIPDKMNPVTLLLSKFNKGEEGAGETKK